MYCWRLIVKRIPVYKGQNNWKLTHNTFKQLMKTNFKMHRKKRSFIVLCPPVTGYLIAQDYIKFLKETDKEWQLQTLILCSIISYSFSFLTSFILAFGLLISFHNLQQICMNSEDSYDTLNKCCEF